MFIEQGPIRPPSEAGSLLIRVTRNCPWNRCAFCKTYKKEKFSRRPLADILQDIDTVRRVAEQVEQMSRQQGPAGRVTAEVVQEAGARHGHLHYHVAAWLYYGGKSVFLQDANSLIVKTAELVQIIKYIRSVFPAVDRITTYARANTAARKTEGELRELREAGLSRIHMGMESGSDTVLKFIQKGITAADLLEAARKIRGAGLSLCWYIMPGLGGREYSREHALETAAVINAGNPDFIRFRTLSVLKGTPLYEMMKNGEFTPLEEDEAVEEQRLLLASLQGVTTAVVSDHILNLLQELEGTLPGDKDRMLGIIDRYLALSPAEKANYQLGRRAGVYAALDDMKNPNRYRYVEKLLRDVDGPESLQKTLDRIRRQFV
ncbi:radical SAM protein [Desulfoscipio geothermicus]|uniref:Radical_SAM C-terminal domain-containing protein n=1 Tax=Desulfoscipio geothermicus DSM 3669 TaxID=1121426 RepID=A0A1I6EB30_9FIRM|nr:radical SAM protein [Desulfoscipio geothermicus]SFR14847.1 Radical_SAM C-terminal domain-containing protein [Desulfoscipio geothermicus DSM 3669]